jgi:bifunctional N-acetylglucosamine-1-phosphate-uridyltransferase/glucosamine-1-phosphate-acetyltransferase GlmU-like protein
MKIKKNITGIILAAGKGKRMGLNNKNKASELFNGKPLIVYPVRLMQKMEIEPIIIVVGHARHSVEKSLGANSGIIFTEQKKRLGTAHAVKKAIPMIPDTAADIIIMYGDDSYMYNRQTVKNLVKIHVIKDSSLTFLTIQVDNPRGLGRIIRDSSGKVIDIVEEKDASDSQKQIKEINPNLYIFKSKLLKKYISKIPKSHITGEYYLPSIIKLALAHRENIQAVNGGRMPWKGINTPEDLSAAHDLFQSKTTAFSKV